MCQNAVQKAWEMGQFKLNMDFEPTVLDCEKSNPKRTKLSTLMHWLKKLNECPPEPIQCDHMSECHKCVYTIYIRFTPYLPYAASKCKPIFRIICGNVRRLFEFRACSWPFPFRGDLEWGLLHIYSIPYHTA